jgi:hypothetical protein
MTLCVWMASNPSGKEESIELQRLRGRLLCEWLKSAITDQRTGQEMPKSEVHRRTGVSASFIGIILNNCWDAKEERFKVPSEAKIIQIAQGLKIKPDEGLRRRRALPTDAAEDPVGMVDLRPGVRARLWDRTGPRKGPVILTDYELGILLAIYDTQTEERNGKSGEEPGSVGGDAGAA